MTKKKDISIKFEGFDIKINPETMTTQLGIYMQVKLFKAPEYYERTRQIYGKSFNEPSFPFLQPTAASQHFVGLCMNYIKYTCGRVKTEQLISDNLWSPISFMFECLFYQLQQEELDQSKINSVIAEKM